MTSAPRIGAGEFSAAKMGTVLAFAPMPMPRRTRQPSSCGQVWEKALPMTGQRQKLAAKKIAPRRPKKLLSGSESQQPMRALPM